MSSSPAESLDRLEPSVVWAHFAMLCRTPRPSKREGLLREHLRQWAAARGLATAIDEAGNLVMRKAASPGREQAPGVVLQAHLDMVCQKNADVVHDFDRDPIRPVVQDGWVAAEGTTLGADNGMGVALILAALEGADIPHGPLEALFTVDEESGMGGARGLAAEALRGRLMLNLDTEAWGEFYLGCAGGLDVNVRRPGTGEAWPAGWAGCRVEVCGLRGGHSGVDIHEERGNAIKLLVRVLRDLEGRLPLRLAVLQGGTARNALPREAFALVAVPAAEETALVDRLAEWQNLLRRELAGVDESVRVGGVPAAGDRVMAAREQAVWLASLHAAPHGVRRMSREVAGVVETSNNLGMVELTTEGGACNFMVRSLRDSGSAGLAAEIASLFALSATPVEVTGHYPGWTPNPASPLLALCQEAFRREFGGEAGVNVIHAGLECGILAAKYPGMDIVSFGPTIRGAHAPGEAVDVASVERTWRLLKAIMADIA